MQTIEKKNEEKEFSDSSSSYDSSSALPCSLNSTFSSSLSSLSSSPPSPSLVSSNNKKVSFSTVSCRYHKRQQGGGGGVPSKGGFSLGLSWELCDKCPEKTFLLDVYEGLIPPPQYAPPPTSKNARKKQRRKQGGNGLVFASSPPSHNFLEFGGEPGVVKNHHKSRFYPNYKGRPEDSLSVVSSNQRKKLLVAGGCKLDGNETQELAKIREQRKDVGCLCSVTPGMGKGRTCRDAKLCECAANGIQCHADCCECLHHHKRRKAGCCKNTQHFYVYDGTGVDRHRRKKLKELSSHH